MTLEAIYYVSQTIAVFAILGTLSILIAQMRQANKLARRAATRDQIESLKRMTLTIAEAPGLADLWVRGNKDLAQLTEEELMRYGSLRNAAWRTWEALHAQYLDGHIDEDMWNAHLVQLRLALNGASARTIWAVARRFFTPKFQTFLDAQFAESQSDALHDLTSPQEFVARVREAAGQ